MITKLTKINTEEETEEEKAYKQLIEDFNKEAKLQNSKYYLVMDGYFPHLMKPIYLGLGNSLGVIFITYSEYTKQFSFHGESWKKSSIILNQYSII